MTQKRKVSRLDEATATIDEASDKIENTLEHGGQYSSNIVSTILRRISEKFGKAEANKLIDKHGLEALGWKKE